MNPKSESHTMDSSPTSLLESYLNQIYDKSGVQLILDRVKRTLENEPKDAHPNVPFPDEKDIMVITYGDQFKGEGRPLEILDRFAEMFLNDFATYIHILPFYPSTSDDGFSVVDYYSVLFDSHEL